MDGTVSVLDGSGTGGGARDVLGTIPVGNLPWGVGVNARGNRIYIANALDGAVSVLDGASNVVLVTVPAGKAPKDVAVDPDTSRIVITNGAGDTVSILQDQR